MKESESVRENSITADEIHDFMLTIKNDEQAVFLSRYFKTGPGEYGEGDRFLGLRVPQVRKLAKKFRSAPLDEVLKLLHSPIHEERLLSLFLLVHRFSQGDSNEKERIYNEYLNDTRYINNWDLVDGSAEYIVGAFLDGKNKSPIYKLANSDLLWERRIAIMSTFYFIKKGTFDLTLEVSQILLTDNEDLIHKAVGWMLREVGKRDLDAEITFLKSNYQKMPRTMLRYAIEKFQEPLRQKFLKGMF